MKKIEWFTVFVLVLIAQLAIAGLVIANATAEQTFRAELSGDDAGVDTTATGDTTFHLEEDGAALRYELSVSNIENVTMAHIHLAPAGEDGPIAVWLYPSEPPPQLIEGIHEGVLAEGVITEEQLSGPLAGQSLDALIAEIKAGNTYVNVHTEQHPAGEIRGQID